jgi:hypothetical protein
MLNKIYIMLLKSFRCIKSDLLLTTNSMLSSMVLLVLNCGNFMMSNKLIVFFFTHSEVVIVHPSFIGYLLRNELGVVPCWDGFIYQFLLLWGYHKICVDELGHLYVVCEDVEWEIITFSDSYEFVFWLILLVSSINHSHFVIGISTIFKSCDRSHEFFQNFVILNLFHSETSLLSVEEFSQIESM